MTLPAYYEGRPPTSRLYHCPPGSRIILKGESRPRTIDHIKGRHVVMTDGLIVSLCHPVHPDWMLFGDGHGWRPKERTT